MSQVRVSDVPPQLYGPTESYGMGWVEKVPKDGNLRKGICEVALQ